VQSSSADLQGAIEDSEVLCGKWIHDIKVMVIDPENLRNNC
jgi:hypothetical protein